MFEHEHFDRYSFEDIPLNRDCYMMDEKYIDEYEKSLLKVFDRGEYEYIGYVAPVAIRQIQDDFLEFSWYPNHFDRFHEVIVRLPRSEFVFCVGSWRWSEKPRIFVKGPWLDRLYVRPYSVYGYVDAIGTKQALQTGVLTKELVLLIRAEIDQLAMAYPQISFVSFADTILIKSNWTVGHVESDAQYTYEPEIFITVVRELRDIFARVLGLNVYAILTQGNNEYYDDSLLHISKSGNHVCLNSLGLPFAQLLAIDSTVRVRLQKRIHPPADVYMDALFFRSLRWKFEFRRDEHIEKYPYYARMFASEQWYYAAALSEMLDNLKKQ